MNIEEVASRVVEVLEAKRVDYMIVGAFAAMHYGITRSTSDADFVIELKGHRLSEIVTTLGPEFVLEPQTTFEVFSAHTMRIIRVSDSDFQIDVFPVSPEPFDQSCFGRRRRVTFLGRPAFMPTADDVIVQKLRWGRVHDLVDARDVIAVQGDSLDWKYIEDWCDQLQTRDLLERLRAEIPPVAKNG